MGQRLSRLFDQSTTGLHSSPALLTDGEKAGRGEGLLIVIIMSVLAWAPLLHPGFIQSQSGLAAIYDALSVRSPLTGWLPAYGTPGDGPLATWLLVILKAVMTPLGALKLLYALGFALSGVGMFLLAGRLWGNWPGVVAAVVYMLAPYHLSAAYGRGALAESLILAGAPFLFLFLDDAVHTTRWRTRPLVGLTSAGLVLLNFGLGVLFVALGLVWTAAACFGAAPVLPDVEGSRERRYLTALTAAVIGIAAALLVLWPGGGRFLANMPGWREHFVYFFQLFSPGWGFGVSSPGWQDEMSFQLGLAPLGLAIVALWGAHETSDARYRHNVVVLVILACVTALLVLTIAAPLWQIVPLAALLAYPWQLLAPTILLLALLAGGAAAWVAGQGEAQELGDDAADRPAGSLVALAVLLAAAVVASYPYLAPRFVDAADLPTLNHPPIARLGDTILLLEARYDGQGRPGGTVHLTLIWQAVRRPPADYTIFAQLFDAAGTKRGQQDMRPHNGDKPTNTWPAGEIVRDDLTIAVADDAPPGDYTLKIGLYLLATMERLPVADSDQREVVLAPIKIR